MLGEQTEDTNPSFRHLGRYFEDRRFAEQSGTVFMATKTIDLTVSDEENHDPSSSENDLIAILDSGRNKTCHGDQWLLRYAKAVGAEVSNFNLEEETGAFKGIGGSVKVAGVRNLKVGFELPGDGVAIGDIDSRAQGQPSTTSPQHWRPKEAWLVH